MPTFTASAPASINAFAASPANILIDPGRALPYLGQPSPAVRIVEYVKSDGTHTGRSYFVKVAELTNIRPVPDATPYSAADVATAIATDRSKAHIVWEA